MDAPLVSITLAGQPIGAARPRFRRRPILTAKGQVRFAYQARTTRQYQAALRYRGQVAMAGRPPLECPLRVRVHAVFEPPQYLSKKQWRELTDPNGILVKPTRPDLDNILRQLDGLTKVVWRDDNQIVAIDAAKFYGETPYLLIQVYNAVS